MNKKKIIAFFSVLIILIASVLTGCKSQEDRQKAVIQAFGIHETEDVSSIEMTVAVSKVRSD